MKKVLPILLLCTGNLLFGQRSTRIERFFDYSWKECDPSIARSYVIIQSRDSLWYRNDYFIREKKIQMQGSYRDSSCRIAQGLFSWFHPNGKLQATGKYQDGKKQGLWLSYHSNGMMNDSIVYRDGRPYGISKKWFADHSLMDSSVYNQDGTAQHTEWFDNGNLSFTGQTLHDTIFGKWQYYHKNGKLSASELYNKQGSLVSRDYYNERGTHMADTSNQDSDTEFPGGIRAWNKFISTQISFPENYEISGGDKAIVVVDAVIDEDGNVTDVEVSSPFFPAFDAIALNAIKKSPKWKPAISHNRRIKNSIRQPVTFVQAE
ncbi:MAG TPA: energy transducer TonB [Chitinophagaceae bacterium]|nr:energy transducer TonB [Chitinophagaceae bacterium]